jgi:VIT1/CCC1 family predicted Fe2+/Mn2+ transporter
MVLGANDGIISTACLILGVAAAEATRSTIITAGVAGLVAGAASMAIGEYVSVSSQRDSEQADIAKETWELAHTPEHELDELTAIYASKGLNDQLARDVAVALTEKDALKVHMAEELGITEMTLARPLQASVSSAVSFSVGAAIPLLAVALAASAHRIVTTIVVAIFALIEAEKNLVPVVGRVGLWGGCIHGAILGARHSRCSATAMAAYGQPQPSHSAKPLKRTNRPCSQACSVCEK